MNNQINAIQEEKENNPPKPEIAPQQPSKDKPEIQQPSKDLPDKGRPDEIDLPSKKPDIKEPKNKSIINWNNL